MNQKEFFAKISDPEKGVILGKLQEVQRILNLIKPGLEIIGDARFKQVEKGFEPSNDVWYTDGELLLYSQYWLTKPSQVDARREVEFVLDVAGRLFEDMLSL